MKLVETYPGSCPLVWQTVRATAVDREVAQENPAYALAWERHNLTNYDEILRKNPWAHTELKAQANRLAARELGLE